MNSYSIYCIDYQQGLYVVLSSSTNANASAADYPLFIGNRRECELYLEICY